MERAAVLFLAQAISVHVLIAKQVQSFCVEPWRNSQIYVCLIYIDKSVSFLTIAPHTTE